jgi:hypothetical protein
MLECIRTEKQDPNSGLQTGIERSSRSRSSCRNMDIKKDRIILDGYRCVLKSRKKNEHNMRGSDWVAIMYNKKLCKPIQILNKLGTNPLWEILKMKEEERNIGLGISYNLPTGLKYENSCFFDEL